MAGHVLATEKHPGLGGIEDLQDRKAAFRFERLPVKRELVVTIPAHRREITEANNTCRIGRE